MYIYNDCVRNDLLTEDACIYLKREHSIRFRLIKGGFKNDKWKCSDS